MNQWGRSCIHWRAASGSQSSSPFARQNLDRRKRVAGSRSPRSLCLHQCTERRRTVLPGLRFMQLPRVLDFPGGQEKSAGDLRGSARKSGAARQGGAGSRDQAGRPGGSLYAEHDQDRGGDAGGRLCQNHTGRRFSRFSRLTMRQPYHKSLRCPHQPEELYFLLSIDL